jgi:hypothetical protein
MKSHSQTFSKINNIEKQQKINYNLILLIIFDEVFKNSITKYRRY